MSACAVTGVPWHTVPGGWFWSHAYNPPRLIQITPGPTCVHDPDAYNTATNRGAHPPPPNMQLTLFNQPTTTETEPS